MVLHHLIFGPDPISPLVKQSMQYKTRSVDSIPLHHHIESHLLEVLAVVFESL